MRNHTNTTHSSEPKGREVDINNNNNNNKFILSPKIPGSSVDSNNKTIC